MLRLNSEKIEFVVGEKYSWYSGSGEREDDFIFQRIGTENYDPSGVAWCQRGSWMPVNRLFPYGGEVFKGRVRR